MNIYTKAFSGSFLTPLGVHRALESLRWLSKTGQGVLFQGAHRTSGVSLGLEPGKNQQLSRRPASTLS